MNPDTTQSRVEGTVPCRIRRVAGDHAEERDDVLAREEPLEIQLGYERNGVRVFKSISVTMRTPGHDRELAAGFLLGEQIIENAAQMAGISEVESNVVRVELSPGISVDLKRLERNFYTTSSCGVCGRSSLAAITFSGGALNPREPVFDPRVINGLSTTLRSSQVVFDATGGLHAAALFDNRGRLLGWREDVGRHNAVDKVIGAQLLAGAQADFRDQLLFVSGRASFELMQKALLAGIPVLAAIGAPSSLAVELAQHYGATLLGFVRDGRFNIYCGAARIPGHGDTSAIS